MFLAHAKPPSNDCMERTARNTSRLEEAIALSLRMVANPEDVLVVRATCNSGERAVSRAFGACLPRSKSIRRNVNGSKSAVPLQSPELPALWRERSVVRLALWCVVREGKTNPSRKLGRMQTIAEALCKSLAMPSSFGQKKEARGLAALAKGTARPSIRATHRFLLGWQLDSEGCQVA